MTYQLGMVKSFQGVRVEKPKIPKRQPIMVSDYMATNLITFRAEQTISEVIEVLIHNRISGGPVINEDNELIGVISEGDCLKEVVKGKYDNIPILSGTVKEHMATNIVSIGAETNIFEAAQMFLNRRLRRFPVIKQGKLIGQISQKDVMKAVIKMKSARWR